MKYQRVMMFKRWNILLLFNNLLCIIIPTLISGDNLALLSGTLRTYQKAACDEEWMSLRCPSMTTISVQLAQYGRAGISPALCQTLASSSSSSHPEILMENSEFSNGNLTCHWPQAIQTVVGLCQKKASCKFQTSPRTFGGDPCPGTRKYVEVAFKCRPSEFKSVIGCQDEVIQLKCNRSSRLAIYSANYGRTEYESVQCPQPSGVPEESCLSSFATETVMQMCHGKRNCALNADPATFGNPCKAESRMYLKVIHTCVPRKVLKEKYQGAPEPDEIFEDDVEDEVIDSSVSGVIEQPSIYSPDHSKGAWGIPVGVGASGTKTTVKPNQTPLNQTSEKVVSDHDDDDRRFQKDGEGAAIYRDGQSSSSSSEKISPVRKDGNYNSPSGLRIIYLVSQGINAYDYVSRNSDKVYLYVAISVASVLFLVVVLITVKIIIYKRRAGRETEGGNNAKPSSSSSSAGPLVPPSSGLSDIDELSLVLDPNDITFTELPSILRHSTSTVATSPTRRENTMAISETFSSVSATGENSRANMLASPSSTVLPTVSGSLMMMTTGNTALSSGRPNEVVRFSNTLGRHDRDLNNPRSLSRNSASNFQFYYG